MDLEALSILTELQRRSEHQFHKYVPQQGQGDFHASDKYIRLLFGGNQSGKSRAAAQEVAWWFTHAHPYRTLPDRPLVIWVVSTEYSTIRVGVYRHLLNLLPDWEIAQRGAKVQGHDLHSFFKSPRGDELYFYSSKGGEDVRTKFQAAAVDLVAIDEEIEGWIWDELEARMLSTGGSFIISATLVESYDWTVNLERRAEIGDKDIFLTRLHTDKNPYIDKVQVERLADKWDEDTKRYRFYGHSKRHFGLVYPGFSQQNVIPSFRIPKEWPRWNIVDPGYRTFAGLWGTITPHKQAIVYRELYIHYAELPNVANEIRLLERGEQIDNRIIDDKIGHKLITGQIGVSSQLSQYYHLYYTPAIKSVHAGIEEVRHWLYRHDKEGEWEYDAPSGKVKLSKGINLFFFDTCINLISEIAVYRIRPAKDRGRSRNDVADEPVKIKDHLVDCLRYWLIAKPSYFIRPTDTDYIDEEVIQASHDLATRFDRDRERKKRRGKETCHALLGTNW